MGAMGRKNRKEENGGGEWERRVAGRIARGDSGAMRDFYDAYSPQLTAVCCRYIGCPDSMKDVLQESFIKIFDSISRFEYRGPGSLKAWASRIVANESLKYLKKSGRGRPQVTVDALATMTDEEYPDIESVPAAVILDMISSLPDGYRNVFNLHVFEDKSHREIAAILNIAEGTSASQLYMAKRTLAGQIKDYMAKHA